MGALQGNVVAVANNNYRQVGSDVISPQGNITISAAKVDIVEARETSRTTTEDKTSQSGFGVTFSNPVLSVIEGVQQSAQTISNASNVKDSRVQALAAASAALTAYNTYKQVAALVNDPAAAASIGVNLSIGTSKSQSNTENTSNTAVGSNVAAGGDVTIAATGAGLDSNLTVQGSRINAGGNATLMADNQVNLLAAINTASERSSNSNSGASLGIGFSVGAKSGFSLNASASSGKGEGNGDEIRYTNTQVQAGNTLLLASVGDTNLIGAVAAAKQVTVQTGGNLTIQSLQDKSTYTESQSSSGGGVSLCIPPFCFGASSGSFSVGKSNIDSNFQSVGEQSAIRAGDGGFSVNAGGNTTLAGGQITSTQKAVDDGKNSFATGGALTLTDIQNVASYEGSGYRIGGGISGTLGDQTSNEARQEMANRGMSDQDITRVKTTANNVGGGVGFGSESGNAASTTTAGISGIAGNTAARTGDAEAGLKPIFNKDEVKASIDAQIAITQSFGRDASKAVGDYAKERMDEAAALAKQADTEPDEAKAKALTAQAQELRDNWGPNGTLRLAAHTIIGGLTGGASGALGAAAGTLTAPAVEQALLAAGVEGPLASTVIALASTAAGAIAGGTLGAGAAANEVINNYLDHRRPTMLRPSEREQYEAAASECATKGDAAACSRRDELAALSAERDRKLAQVCSGQVPGNCGDLKTEAIAMGNRVFTTPSGFTYANSPLYTALNVATIGPVTDPRTGTFHDTAARSTSEAILLEAGNQIAGAALSLMVREALVLGKTSLSLGKSALDKTVDMLENMALRNVQVGAINSLRPAEVVNATMKSVPGWEPAWQAGTVVADVTLKPGSRVNMVVDADTYALLNKPGADLSRAYGGWATYDSVTTQAYARNQLAITETMKSNVGYVIEVEITRPVYAQVGITGAQSGVALGGGNQLHFVVPPAERVSIFKYVANSGKALQ